MIFFEKEGKEYLPLSHLLDLLGIDPKTAKQKAGENNIPLHKNADDGRIVTICRRDIARFIGIFPKKISEINREKIAEVIGKELELQPDNKPETKPENKSGNKNGKNPEIKSGNNPAKWHFVFGEKIGDFYASTFFAYFVLSTILLIQAILHAQAAAFFLPFLNLAELLIIVFGIQMVVLVGTMHSQKFGGDKSYWSFLAAFALYDAVMNGCNLFRSFEMNARPTLLDIVGLTIRITLTFGFSLATVYYAILIKKIRA
jgi:hypothetical protein